MYRQNPHEQTVAHRSPRWWRILSVLAVALFLGVLMQATLLLAAPPTSPAAASSAQSQPDHDGDDEIETYGVVITRPEGTVGTWVISNTESTSFTVTSETVTEGDLSVGACVEVYTDASAPTIAVKIKERDAFKCGGDDDDEHEDKEISRYGVIVTRPVESVGSWIIGEKTLSVTESTVLEGALEVGTCVEVKVLKSDLTTAIKIEAKDAFKCGSNDDDDQHDNERGEKHYGIIERRPEGKVGLWVIGGETYSVTERTKLDFDHGRLAVGVCAKVETVAHTSRIAKEIESENTYKCRPRDDDDNARGQLFGLVEVLPDDLDNGIWAIGGMRFVVSPTTELITKGGTFSVGVLVKVDFTSNISDTNFARRIEIKYPHLCRRLYNAHQGDSVNTDGDDDYHRYGYCPGHEGKTIGLIDRRPEGTLLGDWVIGGIPYVTNARTVFAPGHDFLTGERVKVEYVVLNDNTRLATKLKETNRDGGISDPNHSLIVGFVDAKPEAFIGDWTINGAPFVAVSETIFIEHGSIFAVGSYVVVEYEIVDDQRIIFKILTYVPPGAGDDDSVGTLQSVGAVVATAGMDSLEQSNEVWTVDGVEYIVSEATQIVDSDDNLEPGVTVAVNSYTEDGQRYATLIRTQLGQLMIPYAAR